MNRYDYLREQFVQTKKLTINQLNQIVKSDPTSITKNGNIKVGKYTQWIIKQTNNPLFWEDLYKISEDLLKFEKIKHQLNKRDINHYDTQTLYSVTKKNWSSDMMFTKKQLREHRKRCGIQYVYEDDRWEVIIPLNEKSSYDVAGSPLTRWCTATKNHSYFKKYNRDGKLYILRDKEQNIVTGKCAGEPRPVYQFHFQTNSFYDYEDNKVDIVEVLKNEEGLKKFFKSMFLQKENEIKFVRAVFELYDPHEEDIKKYLLTVLKRMFSGRFRRFPINNTSINIYYLHYGFNYMIDFMLKSFPVNIEEIKIEIPNYNEEGYDIPPMICKFKHLKILTLNGFVKSFPKNFGKLEKLYVLSVFKNKVKSIPDDIYKLKRLQILDIREGNCKCFKQKKQLIILQ